MSALSQYHRVYKVIPEAYFLYKGFYRNVEVVIRGDICDYDSRRTRLWVKLLWNGHEISWVGREPYHTLVTAQKHAREYIAELERAAECARRRGAPERADYRSHVQEYRFSHPRQAA